MSLHRHLHVTIAGVGEVPRLYFFNDLNAGPIGSGLYPLMNGYPKTEGFFHGWGIYFWRLRMADGSAPWELEITLLYPMWLSSVLPPIWLLLRKRRAGRGFAVVPLSGRGADDGKGLFNSLVPPYVVCATTRSRVTV